MAKKKKKNKNIVPVSAYAKVMNALRLLALSFSSAGVRSSMERILSGHIEAIIDAHKGEQKRNPSRRSKERADAVRNIAYRFVGYPDEVQAEQLNKNIGGCRWLWNRMKSDRDEHYKIMGTALHNTPAEYKDLDGLEWLNELDSYALLNVQLNHESAYNDFFSGDKGYPKFKKKHLCRDSYTTNKDKRSNNIKLEDGRLTLPKITGTINVECHREIPEGLTLKKCTICHEPDGKWMFSLVYEYPAEEHMPNEPVLEFLETGDDTKIRHIGLDMSLPELYVDSDGCLPGYMLDGVLVSFRKQYHNLEGKIAKEQRKLSRMVRDSSNYRKQCIKIAKLHAKAKHARNDFLHQLAVRLARDYDIISIEDLDISAMKQALKFGKSISDNGWGTFIRILEQKCEEYGAVLVRVDKWFPSSKTCSHCGHVHKELELKDRTYVCPVCGHIMDRDHQAAVNIDQEGLRIFYESRYFDNFLKENRFLEEKGIRYLPDVA